MDELDDIVEEFLAESRENLDVLDDRLLALERGTADRAGIAEIFRTVHTIKGTCGFLGFPKLERITHAGESLLAAVRDGDLDVTPQLTEALLGLVDAVRAILGRIAAGEGEGDGSYSELLGRLQSLEAASVRDAHAPLLGEILVASGETTQEQVSSAVTAQAAGDDRRIGAILVEQGAVEPREVLDALHAQTGAAPGRPVAPAEPADAALRIDVALLDKLMTLVGELVLTRNQIVQLASADSNGDLAAPSQRLNLITSELQEGVMKTRMQPIGSVWSRFPRMVRDLAVSCGKQVAVDLDGRETELDKAIIEAVKDPLTHLVRNAVDHGIELPAVREGAGKDATGQVAIRAYHEGGHVTIEVSDDGAGIHTDALRAHAVGRGVLTADQAAGIGEREALHLIFAPGLSTAGAVTNVSGRGVGMDVVRTNIERVGGIVDVATDIGRGTTFTIKIPLTLAIIPALIVTADGERYAIPQLNLVELVRLEDQQGRRIEHVHGAPVYRLRGRLLPVVDLATELGSTRPARGGVRTLAVLQADGRPFGLLVDEVNDTQEIVVKPLGMLLRDVTVFTGATIMGDGRVALILDVLGLAQRARVFAEAGEGAAAAVAPMSEEAGHQRLLVVSMGQGRRLAVPLGSVSRLEEFPTEAIERAGSHAVLQYRGEIMTLIDVAGVVGYEPTPADGRGKVDVVVHRDGDRSIGLVVGRIVDIVEDVVVIDDDTRRDGLMGSAVLQGRVTDVVDLAWVLAAPERPRPGVGDVEAVR